MRVLMYTYVRSIEYHKIDRYQIYNYENAQRCDEIISITEKGKNIYFNCVYISNDV